MVGTKHRLTPTCQRRILSSNISNSITAGARLKWSGERSRILPLLVALDVPAQRTYVPLLPTTRTNRVAATSFVSTEHEAA